MPFAVPAPPSNASAGLDVIEFRDIGLAEALPTSCERAIVRPVAYQVPVVVPEPVPERVPLPVPVPAPTAVLTRSPNSSTKLDVIEFRGIALEAAMRTFSEQTGLNIVASPEASKTQVTIYLHNVTADAALDAMCTANDLWHKQDKESGIIRIYTAKEYQRDLTSFREEQTEVFTLLYPNPVDVANAIRSVYGDRVILNLQSPHDQDIYQDLTQRFNRFDIVDQRTQGFGQSALNNGTGGTGGYGGRAAMAARRIWRHGRIGGQGGMAAWVGWAAWAAA